MSRFRSNTIQCKFCDTALSLRRADILAERRSCRRWRSRTQGRARMRFRHLTCKCLSPGMPRVMGPYGEMEIVILPETTYILIDHIRDSRRIHFNGPDFPANME